MRKATGIRALLAALTTAKRELSSISSISRGKGFIAPTAACRKRKRQSLQQAISATRVEWRSIASRIRQQEGFRLQRNFWWHRLRRNFRKASLGPTSPARGRQTTWCAARTLRVVLIKEKHTEKFPHFKI